MQVTRLRLRESLLNLFWMRGDASDVIETGCQTLAESLCENADRRRCWNHLKGDRRCLLNADLRECFPALQSEAMSSMEI